MPEFNPDSYLAGTEFNPDAYLSETSGITEPIRAVASSIGREIVGGIAGLGQALNPFAEEGAGAAMVESFREGAFKPETPEGKENLKLFGELVQKGIDVVNYPISGLFGLAELISGEGIDKAVETIKSVQDDGLGQTLGRRSLEETGSPLQATIGAVFPEFAMSLTAARPVAKTIEVAGKIPKATIEAAKKAPALTRELAEKAAPVISQGKELATSVFEFQTPARQRIAKMLDEGITDKETAGFKLEPSKLPRIDEAKRTRLQKAFGIGAPKALPNLLERSAMEQGFDRGVVASIKGASATDRRRMIQMTKIRKRGKENADYEAVNRPSDIAGDSLLRQIDFVKKNNSDAGRQLSRIASTLKGKEVDIGFAVDGFIQNAENKLGVVFDENLVPDFSESTIRTIGPSRKLIKDISSEINRVKNIDGFKAHKLKKFIDENVSHGKSQSGLRGETESVAKSLRANINESIGELYPKYKEANKRYSDTIGALEEIQKASGSTVDLFAPNAEKALGTVLRGLMNNTKGRANLMNAIDSIESVADKYGGSFGDNLTKQTLFVDELDRVFGPVARTGFQSQIGQAIKQGAGAVRSPTEAAIKVGEKVVEKAQNINEVEAFKALEALLREKQ